MRRRRGYTLIEMLVVLSAASTVLSISAVLVHRTMRMAAQAQAFHTEEATAWRLSAQLRSDAAGATTINLSSVDEEVTVTLETSEGSSVIYQLKPQQIERSQELEGGREARDLFVLPSVAGWKAEAIEQSAALKIEATSSLRSARLPAPIPISLVIRARELPL
jgi:prepilin-type N-terminal cleavage/methylation domain-containing protein